MVNKLGTAKRVRILHLLLEGMSMRAICRAENVSWRTVGKLLNDAARICRKHHDLKVRGIRADDIQCDELWSFCYSKQKKVKKAKAAPKGAGDVWTWTAIDPDSKLLIAYRVGDHTDKTCKRFIKDLRLRVASVQRVRICTDGNASYVKPIKRYFGHGISYSQLVKNFAGEDVGITSRLVYGKHTTEKASTSYIERLNLTIRSSIRRFTRKTNGFSKTLRNHRNAVHLFATYYNFIRIHQTLGTIPAVAAGLARHEYSLEWLVGLIDQQAPKPKRPEVYQKRVREA